MIASLVPALLFLPVLLPADISWSETLAAAEARAQAENKVLFVAVHMPGERANERLATKVYREKVITQLSERTVNVVAMAMDRYQEQGTRMKLGGLTEEQLQRLDIDLRASVLEPDEAGYVVAPQHVFLKPDGEVILSVPYEVTTEELEWCFVQAIAAVDPENAPKASGKARVPKRLIMGAVIAGSDESIGATPATLEEVRALIKELKKSARGEGRREQMMRLITADEEEARDYITQQLRGGSRRGASQAADLLRNIQLRSPTSWWEVVVEFGENNDPLVREEVAAILEILAAPESLKPIKKILGKEKDPRLEGMWLRAQASAGAADSKTRKATLKAAQRSKETITRANATLALGYLTPGEDVKEVLVALVADEEAPATVRSAAIIAMAMTRDGTFKEILTPIATEDGERKEVAAAALATLEQGDLVPLGPFVRSACGDLVQRERLFGQAQGR